MMLDHCVNVLSNGNSSFLCSNFTDSVRVSFKLQSGVSTNKLNGIKTALAMIEIMKIRQSDSSIDEQYTRLNNFIEYIFTQFSDPVAMAIVKYAIKERSLVIRNIAKTEGWKVISSKFKPVMLENSKDKKDLRVYAAYERFYNKLVIAEPISQTLNEYLTREVDVLAELESELA